MLRGKTRKRKRNADTDAGNDIYGHVDADVPAALAPAPALVHAWSGAPTARCFQLGFWILHAVNWPWLSTRTVRADLFCSVHRRDIDRDLDLDTRLLAAVVRSRCPVSGYGLRLLPPRCTIHTGDALSTAPIHDPRPTTPSLNPQQHRRRGVVCDLGLEGEVGWNMEYETWDTEDGARDMGHRRFGEEERWRDRLGSRCQSPGGLGLGGRIDR